MAKEVVTIVRDDLDNTEGAETVEFAIDGQYFTIDLSDKNQKRLREALAPFVAAATPTQWPEKVRTRRLGRKAVPAPADVPTHVIRDWWRDDGNQSKYELPSFNDRGRIPLAVQEAFQSHN